ncbi:MAG: hypothetical protein EXQ92_09520 [Alphaproteobacteria bacterium]|nr:hypothetical protein [Alphaproteobacteria bacterium]
MDHDLEATIAHVVGRIGAAEVVADPFPHMVIADFLPPRLYRALLDAWPPTALFEHVNSMHRREVWIKQRLGALPPDHVPLWRLISRTLKDANSAIFRRFQAHLGAKFEPYIGPTWPERVRRLKISMGGLQLASYPGRIGLPPHVDHARLITNAFLYCNERDEADTDQATLLYRSLGLALPGNLNIEGTDIMPYMQVAGTVPYQPNLCLTFLNTPRAFHGVAERDIGPRDRRLMIFNAMLHTEEAVRLFGEVVAR